MPQIRRILGTCTIETALRRRVCHRDRKHHSIERDSPCLVVKDAVSGGSKNYRVECAFSILDQAADDLNKLRDELA